MTATVLLANLADIAHNVNTVGNDISGEVVRDRWNQRATVIVSDAPTANSLYVSDSLHNVWRQGHATLGTRSGSGAGEAGSTWVLPT